MKTPKTYQFKITLLESKPAIWRRFLVPDQFTFDDLHQVIQIIMGWTDTHLSEFDVDGVRISSFSMFGDIHEEEILKGSIILLNELLFKEKQIFYYLYDFGDGWDHKIVLEKIIDEECLFPICLAGKMHCPPENIGGIFGYYELLRSFKNKEGIDSPFEEGNKRAEFNPETFDIEEVNNTLIDTFYKK